MRRATCPEQTSVTLKIKVELRRVRNVSVDDCASGAISAAIRFFISHREEAHMVPLCDNNDSNLR